MVIGAGNICSHSDALCVVFGVAGKTELCKTLAETYYGSEKDMIRIDMSEYGERVRASINFLAD